MCLWFILVLIAFTLYILKYNYDRLRLYKLAKKLPGPLALPILGNGLKFLCNPSDAFNVMYTIISQNPLPARLWLGPYLLIAFDDPNHLEKILLSTKITYKHKIYDILKSYLGVGLITNSGPLWKSHRKIIQPLFTLKNFSKSSERIQKNINILTKKLEKRANGENFDINTDIHHCYSDIISDIILGKKLNSQLGDKPQFLDSYDKMYVVLYCRMIRPWYYPDFLYKFTSDYEVGKKIITEMQSFAKQGLDESWHRVLSNINNHAQDEDFRPIIDQILDSIKENPKAICDKDMVDHLITLFLASEDTSTLILSFLCVLLGMNPNYQRIAADEVRTVLGDSINNTVFEDYRKLKYLDMCIKEVLRLMPIAPFILRETTEDFKIDQLIIPQGCAVVMSIMTTHRHPDHWEHPNEFYPDHFLPEAVEKRHPYAFVPFSAGPRGCIGKLYAYELLRLVAANILHKFEIEADGTIHDIELKADISVRSKNGYSVRLKKRL